MLKTQAALLDEPLSGATIVRLLPYFDTYLLGYQNRDLSVPPMYGKRVNAGGGMGVYEFVVGKQGKKEYPHLDKKPSTREETHEWKRMSRYDGY
jgi:hypothetical protein